MASASDVMQHEAKVRVALRGMERKRGTSFLEYALLAALVGIVGAVGVMKYGQSISEFFSTLAGKTASVSTAVQENNKKK